MLDAPKFDKCDLLVIAGEHSGDEHSEKMLNSLYATSPNLNVCAIGGAMLRSTKAQFLFDLAEHAVVGLVEVLKNYSFFKNFLDELVAWIDKYRPRAICLVDYPGLNLALAKELKKRGISVKGGGDVKVLYYISPQIWAWKAKRRFKMEKLLDSLAVIFPFEKDCYKDTSLNVEFVGHPFLEEDNHSNLSYDKDGKILLLPGSRIGAISRIFPAMLNTVRLLDKEEFLVIYPDDTIKAKLDEILAGFEDIKSRISFEKSDVGGIKAKSVLMSSGTMSLVVCLAGIAGAIVYVANPITYLLGSILVKIKYLGICNIILDRPAWKEFIQFRAKPKALAKHLDYCSYDPSAIEQAHKDADELRQALSAPRNLNLAKWILRELGN